MGMMPTSTKCATCPRQLSPTDLKQRCLRCKPCRLAKRPTPQSKFVINAEKNAIREGFVPTKAPEKTSWWMGLDRDQLQVEAQRRSEAKRQMGISMSPTGVTT